MADEQIDWEDNIDWEKEINQPRTAQEIASQPKSFFENITAPNTPEGFNALDALGRIGASTAMGAGTGLVFPVIGPIAGGVSGLASGIAGEAARVQGASDLDRFAAESVAGLGTTLAGPTAKALSKVVSPVSYRGGRAISILESDRIAERALQETKNKLFGKATFDVNAVPVNAEETQLALRQSLGNLDIPTDMKASSFVRQQLYSNLKQLRATQPDSVFIKSPEYKELMEGVKDLVTRTRMSKEEVANLNKILAEDLSKRPGVSDFATDDIINLIQNGGVYQVSKKGAEAETRTKIPEDARLLLREKFNKYLERSFGKDDVTYNALKDIERQEFIAEARDAIPALINSKFRVGSKELDFVLNTVKNSPEGKRDLVNAVNQHLASFDDTKKLLTEFGRLRGPLKEAGIYTDKQIRDMYQKINSFDANLSKQSKIDFLKTIMIAPTLAVGQAEAGSKLFDIFNVKPSPVPAFNM